jgi:hypothetical protein
MNIANWTIAGLVIVAAVAGIIIGVKYGIERCINDGFDFDENDMDVPIDIESDKWNLEVCRHGAIDEEDMI